jgi:GNAT superfamily N-acetyltransferase
LAQGSQHVSKQDSFHILSVNPPVNSPAFPPLALARAAALLSGSDLSLEQYDANLEFFLNHILTPERLTDLVDLIEKRGKQGLFDQADPFFTSLFSSLTANPEQWALKIAGVDRSLAILKKEDFYRPESCLTALKDIGDLLDLASLAYYPSRIQWGRFSNSAVRDLSQVRSFIEDHETNPFLLLCYDRLASRIARSELNLLILFVSVPDQVLAALTIARFCKKQRPRLHVAIVGNYGLLTGMKEYGDSLLAENEPKALCDLVARLAGVTISKDSAMPDFSGLPLKDYLTPAIVLPFEKPSNPENNGAAPSRLQTFMVEAKRDLDAKGFLSSNTNLTPAYIAEMTREMVEQYPTFCMGLECILNDLTATDKITAAYEAGVRFIQWRDPTGDLNSLTTLLWDVSRAGIWNHVVIAAEQDNSLTQGLIDFVAANPNIVHSWIKQQQRDSPFAGSTAQTERSSVGYTQVAKLSGKPLWQGLNETVYQLLYLKRHGVKKVMRWRVRDDGYSVYTLGQNITYHFVAPKELPPGYMDEICRMVEAGGSVGTKWVRYNLERAFLIGYVIEEGVIVGNSSLKYPRSEYIEAVNKQSGLDLTDYLERGYTSVRPEYRGMGIGTKLLEGLTARVGKKKVYSIISSDNIATQKIALRNKTKQVATFYSKSLGKEIGVWIPAWMIED